MVLIVQIMGNKLPCEVYERSIINNTNHKITAHKLLKSDLMDKNIFTRNDRWILEFTQQDF